MCSFSGMCCVNDTNGNNIVNGGKKFVSKYFKKENQVNATRTKSISAIQPEAVNSIEFPFPRKR